MTLRNIIFTSAFLALGLGAHAQYTEEINSNRPGLSMGAFAVGETILQVEAGLNGVYEKHDVLRSNAKGAFADLTLRYGAFVEELEFVIDMQYRVDRYEHLIYDETRSDFSRFTAGAKYMVYDPDKYYEAKRDVKSWWANHKFKWRSLIPSLGVYAGVNAFSNNQFTFPEDKTSFKAMLITQNHFGRWVWVNNFIIDKLGTTYPSTGWITTFTHGFSPGWSGFFEFQAYKSNYYGDGVARVGAAYLLKENLQLDASISGNFKDTPQILYGGIGISWRFTANYQDVMLPGKGDREDLLKEDQDKQKKEKDARRKEKDARKKALEEEPLEGGR